MKSAMMIVLLMAALVFTAKPVGALTPPPTIQQLPQVVIGDNEDIDSASTATLLRYVNVANLNAITNEPNSGDPGKLRFWYETTGAKLKIGTPLIKDPLTPDEAAAIKASNPTMPPMAKELTGGTAFWMSLIQDAPGVGKISATSVATASAAVNGATPAELEAAGATGKHSVTLYVIDDVLTSRALGSMVFDVYSIIGMTDQYSHHEGCFGTTAEYNFENANAQGWAFGAPMISGFALGTKQQTGTAIGHGGASGTSPRYSFWGSPVYAISASNMSNYIFIATMSLSGTAASPAAAPGFRLLYADGYYMHVGGMQINSLSNISAVNAPYTGNNKTLKLVWALPSDLVEYGDTGKMNKVFEPTNDLRSYSLLFELMQMDPTDSGNIMLENCLVQKIQRPAPVTPTREWGGPGAAFNASGTGWTTYLSSLVGFNNAIGFITAANMTFSLAGTNTSGYKTFVPNNALDTTRPAWTTGKMLRTSYRISSSDASQVPSFRFLTLSTYNPPASGKPLGSVFWGDAFSYSNVRDRINAVQSPNGLPGAPKTSGSTIELYHASQYAGTGAEKAILTPQCDLIDASAYSYPRDGWQRPAATMTVSNVKMEMLDEASVLP